MKIKAKVLAIKDNLIKAQVSVAKFRVGDIITISKGGKRSSIQNNLYWAYLTYLVVNHLRDFGHFCPMGLHESLKQYFLAEKKMERGQWKAIEGATTTELSKTEFAEYIKSIDEFVCDFFKIDTTEFWQDYEDVYRK